MYRLSNAQLPQFRDWSCGRTRKSRSMMGLGALAPGQADALTAQADAVGARIDQVRQRVNALAATATIEENVLAQLRDALGALNDRLIAAYEASLAVTEATYDEQRVALEQLAQDVERVNASVSMLAERGPASRTARVALWTGAAVAAAVGLGLIIRHYGKRGRR